LSPANLIVALAVFANLAAASSQTWAQQTTELPQMNAVSPSPTVLSKAALAARFQELKNQYTAIKATTAKFTPVKQTDSAELKLTRSRLNAAMYSYELYESYTQKQRDQLNLLVALSELESVRLQMAMDRLSKMLGKISDLLKQLSANGDALI
jgi:hypothetical protein